MTPTEIEFLIHCHVSLVGHPYLSAPSIKDAIEMFIKAGIIVGVKDSTGVYTTTEKGEFLVKMLCKTPFPVNTWCDPRERK